MCKNNFTNENEFDYWNWDDPMLHPAPEPYPYNPYGPHLIQVMSLISMVQLL